MSTARDRVLDLLAGSDGDAIVIGGERSDEVVLVGSWRIAVKATSLHRLADAGDVVWAGSGVTLPGTDRQERA